MAFQLADKCKRIDGVDLSRRNIHVAINKLARHPAENISFHHSDIFGFLAEGADRYDYAVLTYVVHEMDKSLRQAMLVELAKGDHHC